VRVFTLMDPPGAGIFSLMEPGDFQGHGATRAGLALRFSASWSHPIFSLMGPPQS